MDSNNGGNVDDLHPDPLDIARHFTGSGVRVPVEIVEANGETVVLEEGRNDHGCQTESMEITVEEMPPASGENLSEALSDVVNRQTSLELNVRASRQSLGVNTTNSVLNVASSLSQSSVDSTQLTPSKPTDAPTLSSIASGLVQESNNLQTEEVPSSVNSLSSLGITFDATSAMDPQLTLQQMSHHFQEVSRSLRSEGIEISPETIASHFPPSLAETLAASIINQTSSSASTTLLDSGTQGLQIGGISYSDLADVTRVMNATLDPSLTASSSAPIPSTTGNSDMMTSVFTESDMMPSSPESNFDTNELLNADLGQKEEVTSKLANAGPVGRYYYLPHCVETKIFEINFYSQ